MASYLGSVGLPPPSPQPARRVRINSGKRDIHFMPLSPSEIRASSYGFLHSSPRLDTLTPAMAAKQAFE